MKSMLVASLPIIILFGCKKRLDKRTSDFTAHQVHQTANFVANKDEMICLKKNMILGLEVIVPFSCFASNPQPLYQTSHHHSSLSLTASTFAIKHIADAAGAPPAQPRLKVPEIRGEDPNGEAFRVKIEHDSASSPQPIHSGRKNKQVEDLEISLKRIEDGAPSPEQTITPIALKESQGLSSSKYDLTDEIERLAKVQRNEILAFQSKLKGYLFHHSPKPRELGKSYDAKSLGEPLGYFNGTFKQKIGVLNSSRTKLSYAYASHEAAIKKITQKTDELRGEHKAVKEELNRQLAEGTITENVYKDKIQSLIHEQTYFEFRKDRLKEGLRGLAGAREAVDNALERYGRDIVDITLDETRKYAQLAAFKDAVQNRLNSAFANGPNAGSHPRSIQLIDAEGNPKTIADADRLLSDLNRALSQEDGPRHYHELLENESFADLFTEFAAFEPRFRLAVMSRNISKAGLISHALGKASKKLNTKAKSDDLGFIPVDQSFSSKVVSGIAEDKEFDQAKLVVFNWLSDKSRAEIISDGLPMTFSREQTFFAKNNGVATEFVTLIKRDGSSAKTIAVPKSEFGPGQKFNPEEYSSYKVHMDPRSMDGGSEALLQAWMKENNIQTNEFKITAPIQKTTKDQFIKDVELFKSSEGALGSQRNAIDSAIANAEDLIDSYARYIIKANNPGKEFGPEELALRVQQLRNSATPVVPDNDLLSVGASDTSLLARQTKAETIVTLEIIKTKGGSNTTERKSIVVDGVPNDIDTSRKIAEAINQLESQDQKVFVQSTQVDFPFEFVKEKGVLSASSNAFYSQGTKGTSIAGIERNIHHGAEVDNLGFPQALEGDYPITLVDSSGNITLIPKSYKGENPHEHLFKKINELSEQDGIEMAINPAYILYRAKKISSRDFHDPNDAPFFDQVQFTEYQWQQLIQYIEYRAKDPRLSAEARKSEEIANRKALEDLLIEHTKNFPDGHHRKILENSNFYSSL